MSPISQFFTNLKDFLNEKTPMAAYEDQGQSNTPRLTDIEKQMLELDAAIQSAKPSSPAECSLTVDFRPDAIVARQSVKLDSSFMTKFSPEKTIAEQPSFSLGSIATSEASRQTLQQECARPKPIVGNHLRR